LRSRERDNEPNPKREKIEEDEEEDEDEEEEDGAVLASAPLSRCTDGNSDNPRDCDCEDRATGGAGSISLAASDASAVAGAVAGAADDR